LADSIVQLIQDIFFIRVCLSFLMVYLAVLFLQSGLDKATNFQSNLAWFNDYFKNSILSGNEKWMLLMLTFTEVLTGLVSVVGLFDLWFQYTNAYRLSILMALFNFTLLFSGMRIAKDYQGAASISTYMAVTLLGLMLMMNLK
jgi:putative oxidoreductase